MSDNFNDKYVEKISIEERFDKWKKEFKDEHPIYWWIDNVLFSNEKGLFGYAPHHALTHPHVLLSDLADQIKWVYQRVVRGWDDRAVWSVDYWLDDIMPDILKQLKEDKRGTPIAMYEGFDYDDNYSFSDEQDRIAKKRWDSELDKMIVGFIASKELENFDFEDSNDYKIKYDMLEEIRKNGMLSFVEHYKSLWD